MIIKFNLNRLSELELDVLREIVLGAYNKYKTKVFYDSTLLMYKEQIGRFESKDFDEKITNLVENLHSQNMINDYYRKLIDKVDYFPLLKKVNKKKEIDLNYFISMPVELHIIDTIWTVIAGTTLPEAMKSNIFGNLIAENQLYKDDLWSIEDINWSSTRLFQRYIFGYNKWLEKAKNRIEKHEYDEEGITLVSSDLSRYYYSTSTPFKIFESKSSGILKGYLPFLSTIMKEIYGAYYDVLVKDSSLQMRRGILPIGLSSSMIMSNIYLFEFDEALLKNGSIIFYGRYVDDIIIIYNEIIDKNVANKRIDIAKKSNEGYKNLQQNLDKTEIFVYNNYNYRSELEKLLQYYKTRGINYYGNDDQEVISFRRYFAFDKKQIKNTLLNSSAEKDFDFAKIDAFDSLLFMNYIYDLIEFDNETTDAVSNKIIGYIHSTYKYNMWKEIYRWHRIFKNGAMIQKVSREINRHIDNNLEKTISDIKPGREPYVLKKIELLYKELNIISKVLAEIEIDGDMSNILKKSKMVRSDSLIKKFVKDYKINNLNLDNSVEFHIDYFKYHLPFVHFWEIYTYDQLVNIAFSKEKTYDQSYNTYLKINKITEDILVEVESFERVDGYEPNLYKIDNPTIPEYVVSHPNIDQENSGEGVLTECFAAASVSETAYFIRNLNEAIINKTTLLVFPELYVSIEWLHILLFAAYSEQFNTVYGLKNLVIKNRLINLIGSSYAYNDKSSRRMLLSLVREKNFYSFLERDWCIDKGLRCDDAKTPFYFMVRNNNIVYVDYICYEITDILSRGIFKGYVDIVVVPMLNKDTKYFDNIIRSLSRDLSCVVVTSNSAEWGNSSIILPKSSNSSVLTEFKGGFNKYLVSSYVPVYSLQKYNEIFDKTKKSNENKDLDKVNKFKLHPANFVYKTFKKLM
ncbi:MAG: hypothetical protein JEZ05_03070 [Tenericutes bacterium]|nr:hypothetical protein [Mycoplasmatota bacterium]